MSILGQQVYEKVLTIANHQGNANQNRNEIPPHTCQNDYLQETRDKCWLGCIEREPLYTVDGNVNWPLCTEIHQKIKNELSYDPALPLLGIYPKEIKSLYNPKEITILKRYLHPCSLQYYLP